jgi:hypothetical protein
VGIVRANNSQDASVRFHSPSRNLASRTCKDQDHAALEIYPVHKGPGLLAEAADVFSAGGSRRKKATSTMSRSRADGTFDIGWARAPSQRLAALRDDQRHTVCEAAPLSLLAWSVARLDRLYWLRVDKWYLHCLSHSLCGPRRASLAHVMVL